MGGGHAGTPAEPWPGHRDTGRDNTGTQAGTRAGPGPERRWIRPGHPPQNHRGGRRNSPRPAQAPAPLDTTRSFARMSRKRSMTSWLGRSTKDSLPRPPIRMTSGVGATRPVLKVVALVMLHPAFDDSAVTCRQMRRLTDYAQRYGRGIDAKVHWALEVMAGVRTGKVSKDELCWNPRLAVTDRACDRGGAARGREPMAFRRIPQ